MLARCVLLIWLLWCFGLPLALHYHRSGSDVDFDAQTCPGLLADGALAFCCSLVAAVCGLLVALKMLRTVNATVTYELDRVDAEEPFETELPMSFSAFKVLIDHCQTLRFFAAIRLAWPPVLLQSIHAMGAGFGLAVDAAIDGVLMRMGSGVCYGQLGIYRLLLGHVPLVFVVLVLNVLGCKGRSSVKMLKVAAAAKRAEKVQASFEEESPTNSPPGSARLQRSAATFDNEGTKSFEDDSPKSSRRQSWDDLSSEARQRKVFQKSIGTGGTLLVSTILFGSTLAACTAPLDCEKVGRIHIVTPENQFVWKVRALRDDLYSNYVDSDPVECGGSIWIFASFVNLLLLALTGACILHAVKNILAGRKKAATASKTQLQRENTLGFRIAYGYFHLRFVQTKPDRWYWELIVMARKAGYCITTLLLSNGPAALHLAVHCMIAAAALAIQVKYSPVMDQETNRHESISLWTQLLTLLAASMFVPAEGTDRSAFGDVGEAIGAIIVVMLQLCFLIRTLLLLIMGDPGMCCLSHSSCCNPDHADEEEEDDVGTGPTTAAQSMEARRAAIERKKANRDAAAQRTYGDRSNKAGSTSGKGKANGAKDAMDAEMLERAKKRVIERQPIRASSDSNRKNNSAQPQAQPNGAKNKKGSIAKRGAPKQGRSKTQTNFSSNPVFDDDG